MQQPSAKTLGGPKQRDLFDVLEFIAFAAKPITREERVAKAQSKIFAMLKPAQKELCNLC